MNRACGDFLAGAGFAGKQDRCRQAGDAGKGFPNAAGRGRRPDQIVAQERAIGGSAQRVTQHIVLALQPDPVEAARHRIQYLVRAERFQHEIDGAGAQRLNCGVEIGIGRDEDGVGKEADGPLLGQPVDAILARHDIVEDHDVEPALVEHARGFVRVGRLLHMLAARPQRSHEKIAHPGLVIDDQDRGLREGAELGPAGRFAEFCRRFIDCGGGCRCARLRCREVHAGICRADCRTRQSHALVKSSN